MLIQERQIRARLREDFTPHIDLKDASEHSSEERAKIAASRALAALCIADRCKLDAPSAAAWVVDESGDRGIDAIGFSFSDETLYLVQTKTAGGSPSLTEVQKFISGIRLILDSTWSELGPKTRKRSSEIEEWLAYPNASVVAIYSHLGNKPVDKSVLHESDTLMQDINSAGEILDFQYADLRDNFDIRNVAQGERRLKYSLDFKVWSTLSDYRSEIFGVVPAGEIAAMAAEFGDRIYDRNIRKVLEQSSVNETLLSTLSSRPEQFWYFNNGMTIVASGISCDRLRPKDSNQEFQLTGLNVVNGAQTCGAILKAHNLGYDLGEVDVTVRVISTDGRPEDFESSVTRCTNTQNQVGGREFVSLDPRQQEIRDTLNAESIQYCFKSGELADFESFSDSFDLEDATRALACLVGGAYPTRAKREIGRMWSDIKAEPYSRLFQEQHDAATVYNSVRFWRELQDTVEELSSEKESRVAKIMIHSTYLACSILMKYSKARSLDFSDISHDAGNWVAKNKTLVRDLTERIVDLHEEENPSGYAQSYFKNISKVESMESRLIGYIFNARREELEIDECSS